MTSKTAVNSPISFLGHQLLYAYDSSLDHDAKGFYLDTQQSFSDFLTPQNARLLLDSHGYGLNRSLDSKSTAIHKRDYGTIRLALRPNRTVAKGFDIILMDGQHTCDIAAKKGLTLPCTFQVFQCLGDNGIDNLFATFDSGKTRYLGNAITHGFKTGSIPQQYPPINILRLVPGAVNWVREGFPKRAKVAATNSTSMNLIKNDEEVIDFCMVMGSIINKAPVIPTLQNKGAVAGLFCIYRDNDIDMFTNFCSLYWHGSCENFVPSPDSPVAQLRSKMISKAPQHTNEVDHLGWVSQAWKAHINGVQKTQLKNMGRSTEKRDPWTPEEMQALEW